jgi:hypothetical protein
MLLQNSEWDSWLKVLLEDSIWGYMRGVNLAFWITAISIMYLTSIVFMRRAARTDFESQKHLFRSYGLFFILMGITRISFVLAYFIEPYYNLLLSIGYVFGALSLLPLVFTLEKYMITQTKRLFSLIGLILVVLGFVFLILTLEFPKISETSRTVQDIGMPIIALSYLILYGIVIKNSTGDIRKKAIMTLVGMIVFVAGILFDSENLLAINPATMHIAPVVFSLGIILIAHFQKSE